MDDGRSSSSRTRARRRPRSDSSASSPGRSGSQKLGYPRWRIDQRGVPRRVGPWPDARPGEDARHEQQASTCELHICGCLRRRVHAQGAAIPPDGRVQAGERCLRAHRHERSGARGDLGLEHGRDPFPPRGQRSVPECPHLLDHLPERAVRVVQERLGGRWDPAGVGARDLGGDLVGRCGANTVEFLGDFSTRRARRRSDEHRPEGCFDRGRDIQEREVQPLRAWPCPRRPGTVDGVPGRVAQHVHGANQLHERCDGEPRPQQIALAEVEADHWIQPTANLLRVTRRSA